MVRQLGSPRVADRSFFRVDPLCPKCRQPIPPDDVNVANDIALCRSCNHAASYASLARRANLDELSQVDLSRPPSGLRIVETATDVALIMSTRSIVAACFLVPFTAIWSGGSLTGIYGSQIRSGHFNLLQSLFGLPFLAGTMCLVPITLMVLCGHARIRLRGDEGELFVGVSFLGYRKTFAVSEITDVYVEASKPDSDGDRAWGVYLDRAPKPIQVYTSSKAEKRNFVAAVLRAWLGLASSDRSSRRAA